MAMRNGAISRRRLLASASAAGAATLLGTPYLSRAADRPRITHGIQSGDVSIDSGVVWARADRPARMRVEVSTTESFDSIIQAACVDALPDSDFTAKALPSAAAGPGHLLSRAQRRPVRHIGDRRTDDRALPYRPG
jgi:alkaline phosphatase D